VTDETHCDQVSESDFVWEVSDVMLSELTLGDSLRQDPAINSHRRTAASW
jgi:hypothetical protein